MKVVALISGGKDSCFNILQCVAAGHEIVALANLLPESNLHDELDSYMYQTVGHKGVELYSEAMGIPLFRYKTQGKAIVQDKIYTMTPDDEVEDLYQLLSNVKAQIFIEAVSVGAVLSDYQRIRVENVCNRLGLVTLAYLWRRDQADLLQEMIDCSINAIIIKVAALGLDPDKHLGKSITEIQPHLFEMSEKYGLNICGEGGEYETFTLDCPLFKKSVIIDDYETVIHSNDAIAPVGYINFLKLHLVDKKVPESSSYLDRLAGFPVKNSLDYIVDIDENYVEKCNESTKKNEKEAEIFSNKIVVAEPEKLLFLRQQKPLLANPYVKTNISGWCWLGGLVGQNSDSSVAILKILHQLCDLLNSEGLSPKDLVCVYVFLRDMADYTAINSVYASVLNHVNPPVRVCVEAPLSKENSVVVEALAFKQNEESDYKRHTMHVQSISHWAPANIGPYSQAVKVGNVIYIAGQIALVPGSLQLIEGDVRRHCRLILRHIDRLIQGVDANTQIRDVVQGVCYVTNEEYIAESRYEWEVKTNNAITDYIVVPGLPRCAPTEWQVWAHKDNSRFEYEETGYVVGDCQVSLRCRWNYENNVAVIVCNVSSGSSALNSPLGQSSTTQAQPLTEDELKYVLKYTLIRLFRNELPPTSCVCALRVLLRIGHSPSSDQIYSVLSQMTEFLVVPTVLPVCQINHPNIFLSLCAIRHE